MGMVSVVLLQRYILGQLHCLYVYSCAFTWYHSLSYFVSSRLAMDQDQARQDPSPTPTALLHIVLVALAPP